MFDPNAYDVEPRRKFKATEAALFVITLMHLIFSGKLIYDGPFCDHYETWNRIVFYGSLIWMVYLVITLVVQFRNEGLRLFLGFIDYLYLAWLIFLWIYLYVLYEDRAGHFSCSPRWRFAARVFWIFGWAILVCIVCVIIMTILRLINNRRTPHKAELDLHSGHRHGDYEILDQSAI